MIFLQTECRKHLQKGLVPYLRKACRQVNLTMDIMSLRLLLPPKGPPALLPRARGSSNGGMGVPEGVICVPLCSLRPDWADCGADAVASCSPHRHMTGAVAHCPARNEPDRAAVPCWGAHRRIHLRPGQCPPAHAGARPSAAHVPPPHLLADQRRKREAWQAGTMNLRAHRLPCCLLLRANARFCLPATGVLPHLQAFWFRPPQPDHQA